MRARVIGRGAAIVVAGGALVACSTILGFESVTLENVDASVADAAGDVAMDASNDAPGRETSGDGASNEGEAGCGDLMTDPHNCGRCGHDCMKGMCNQGMCTAYALTLTGAFLDTWDLAIDDTYVYFTNTFDNNIYRVGKVDGSNPLKLADQPDAYAPRAIAVDANYIYWSNQVSPGGEIRRCPRAGCGGSPSVLLSQADYPSDVLLLGSRIIWTERTGGIVVGADITDGGNRQLFYQPDDSGIGTEPYSLTSDPSYLYFTDIRTGFTRRAPFDGGALVTLANNSVTNSDGIAVSATDVYFTGGGSADGILWKIAKSSFVNNGSANAFASPLKNPNGVAIDGNYVYWVNAGTTSDTGDGSVMACPLTASTCATPITLATSQHNPNRIRVDNDAVYWANNGASSGRDGSIWKVAKP